MLDQIKVPSRRPVLVIVGWAAAALPSDTRDAIDVLMRKVVAPVCKDEQAVVVSGGTNVGVMAALGRAIAEYAPSVHLVGVAPEAKLIGLGAEVTDEEAAAPEPHHRIVCTAGTSWGDEAPVLVRVAEQIAQDRGVVVLAVGGRGGTYDEIAYAARRRWPVILLTGHGGVSHSVGIELDTDVLGAKVEPLGDSDDCGPGIAGDGEVSPPADQGEQATLNRDKQHLAEARKDGMHIAVPLSNHAAIERALRWRLSEDHLLKDAWCRFATADELAGSRKRPTTGLAAAVLVLATFTVLCAVASAWLHAKPSSVLAMSLKASAMVLALTAAILLGLIDRRSRTGLWIDLRAAAEFVIREIYRYRAVAGRYSKAELDPRAVLADALATVDTSTQGRSFAPLVPRTPLTETWPPPSLWPPPLRCEPPEHRSLWRRVIRIRRARDNYGYRRPIAYCDSLLGPLNASVYDQSRVVDQFAHFERRAREFDQAATKAALVIFVFAGAATFFVAISWHWPVVGGAAVVLATLAAACVSWREYRQRDARAEAMLSACVALRSARSRWLALPLGKRDDRQVLSDFVGEVEDALAAESLEWKHSLRQAYQSFAARYSSR